jgi:membrane protein implicated in regulation of membrane protease activity
MDDAPASNDIRLREGSSIAQRLVVAGSAAAVALCFTPGLFTHDALEIIISVVALLAGAAFVGAVMLTPAVVWIITPEEILIGRQRPFGKLQTRIVRKDDIARLQVPGSKTARARFQLAFTLASGERLISPPLSDVTHVRDTVTRIATQFDVPDVEAPVNPLDASNPEMRLGDPVEPFSRRDIAIAALIVVALSVAPYAYRLWRGLAPQWIDYTLLLLGVVAAFGVTRFANLLTGAFWIIREGDIRVERLWGSGQPRTDQIEGHDVKAITIERRGRSEDEHYIVVIRLHSGRRFRSPRIGSRVEARAVGAEIVRRLAIAAEADQI